MGSFQDPPMLSFACVVAATFVLWFGSAYPALRQTAKAILGIGATVCALLSFYDLFAGSTAAWWFLLTSIALANLGTALSRLPAADNALR